jgi:hypothetical protein
MLVLLKMNTANADPFREPMAYRAWRRCLPSVQRADQSLQQIGTSPYRAAVVVKHLGAFHDCASQEEGSSKPLETCGKVCLLTKLEGVYRNGVWIS